MGGLWTPLVSTPVAFPIVKLGRSLPLRPSLWLKRDTHTSYFCPFWEDAVNCPYSFSALTKVSLEFWEKEAYSYKVLFTPWQLFIKQRAVVLQGCFWLKILSYCDVEPWGKWLYGHTHTLAPPARWINEWFETLVNSTAVWIKLLNLYFAGVRVVTSQSLCQAVPRFLRL